MTQPKAQDAATTVADAKSDHTPAPRFLPLETIGVRLRHPESEPRDPVFGIVANMSETGACYITNRSLSPGTIVTAELSGARTGTEMRIVARVVWCAERLESVKEIVGYMTGVAFQEGAEPVRELLESGLFQIVP